MDTFRFICFLHNYHNKKSQSFYFLLHVRKFNVIFMAKNQMRSNRKEAFFVGLFDQLMVKNEEIIRSEKYFNEVEYFSKY